MRAAPIVLAIFLLIATLFLIYPPADTQPQVRHGVDLLDHVRLTANVLSMRTDKART